jgi:hypothetical protein
MASTLFKQASDDFLWKIADLDYGGHGAAALTELQWREEWTARQIARTHRVYPWRV